MIMLSYCDVVKYNKNASKHGGIRFFRIPSAVGKNKKVCEISQKRQTAWIQAMKRKDWSDNLTKYAFVGVPNLFEELDADFNNKAAISLMYKPFAENPELVSEKIREFYFGNEKKLNMQTFSGLIDMYTDGWFTKCIDDAVRIHLKVSKQPVYNYLFAHKSGASFSEIFGSPGNYHGVCHADELQYLFPIADGLFPHKKVTEEDRKVTKILTTLWGNFAKTGNPTPEINDLITTKWAPIETENLEYLHIDGKKLEMQKALFKERVEFWRSLPLEPKKVNGREEL